MQIVFNSSSNSFQLIKLENRGEKNEKIENNGLKVFSSDTSPSSQEQLGIQRETHLKINKEQRQAIQKVTQINKNKVMQTPPLRFSQRQQFLQPSVSNKLDLICRLSQILEIIFLQTIEQNNGLIEDLLDQMIFLASQITVEGLVSISYTQKLSFIYSKIERFPSTSKKIYEQIAKSIKRIFKEQRQYAHNLITGFQSSLHSINGEIQK